MLRYSSDSLTRAEKSYFLDSIDRYRKGTVPIAVQTNLLKSWAIRFDQTYLLAQTFLDPYPSDLSGAIKTGEARDIKLRTMSDLHATIPFDMDQGTMIGLCRREKPQKTLFWLLTLFPVVAIPLVVI